jgi:hypothetical protein
MMRHNFVPAARASLVAIVCVVLAHAQNDSCLTAIPIGDGLTTGTNIGATTGPDPTGSCTTFTDDVWYAYTASCTGQVIASMCSNPFTYDSVLAAWSGTCGALSEIACDDDFCTFLGTSEIVFPVTAGTVYYLSVGGFSGAQGNFDLNITCVLPLANDTCATAILITEGVVTSGTNLNAQTGPDPLGSCGAMASDVWFEIVTTCNGPYTATTCDFATNYDSVITIWDGSSGCGGLVELACNDDNCSIFSGIHFLNSTVVWTAVAGSTYYISVGGFFGSQGIFNLLVTAGGGLNLNFISAGLGSIGYQVTGAPPAGVQFTALTNQAGAFPNGWWYGIDINFTDLISQITFGFPFATGVTACGDVTIGPFPGLPSGVVLYGVTVAAPVGVPYPTVVSPPASGTIP